MLGSYRGRLAICVVKNHPDYRHDVIDGTQKLGQPNPFEAFTSENDTDYKQIKIMDVVHAYAAIVNINDNNRGLISFKFWLHSSDESSKYILSLLHFTEYF